MKKSFQFVFVAFIGIMLASCSGVFNPPATEFKLADLQYLWLEQTNGDHNVRFTSEQADEAGYYLGREWHEEEDVFESDLLEQRTRDGFPGNGWFKYEFKTTGDLTEIHLMDNGGAEIPKVYIVTLLNSERLEYYEKDNKQNKFVFIRADKTIVLD